MKNVLTKAFINNFMVDAENMNNKKFKTQGGAILDQALNVVQKAWEEGKISSENFFNGITREIDVLTEMMNSNEYSPSEKVECSKRISKLVDSLRHKNLIKEVTLIAAFGAAIATVFGLFFHFNK